MGSNNGCRGFIEQDLIYLNAANTISFGQDTATMFYQEHPYFTGDKIKILSPKIVGLVKRMHNSLYHACKEHSVNFLGVTQTTV